MDYLCAIIFITILIIAVFALLLNVILKKQARRKAKFKEESALNGIGLGISERLYAACPGSKWRWVCRPAGFAANGGIARIDVKDANGERRFMDVCLSPAGYMALHMANVTELVASDTALTPPDTTNLENAENNPAPASPSTGKKPYNEESVATWYNIVLIDALTALIEDLNADGEACLYIGQDGKAYTEESGNTTVVHEFCEMPGMSFWGIITEKLGKSGLFAEAQEGNCIFISWA